MGLQSVFPTIYLTATDKINPYYKRFDPVLIIATVPLMIGKLTLDKYYWYSKDIVSDIAIFVLKRDVKLQLTNSEDRSR